MRPTPSDAVAYFVVIAPGAQHWLGTAPYFAITIFEAAEYFEAELDQIGLATTPNIAVAGVGDDHPS